MPNPLIFETTRLHDPDHNRDLEIPLVPTPDPQTILSLSDDYGVEDEKIDRDPLDSISAPASVPTSGHTSGTQSTSTTPSLHSTELESIRSYPSYPQLQHQASFVNTPTAGHIPAADQSLSITGTATGLNQDPSSHPKASPGELELEPGPGDITPFIYTSTDPIAPLSYLPTQAPNTSLGLESANVLPLTAGQWINSNPYSVHQNLYGLHTPIWGDIHMTGEQSEPRPIFTIPDNSTTAGAIPGAAPSTPFLGDPSFWSVSASQIPTPGLSFSARSNSYTHTPTQPDRYQSETPDQHQQQQQQQQHFPPTQGRSMTSEFTMPHEPVQMSTSSTSLHFSRSLGQIRDLALPGLPQLHSRRRSTTMNTSSTISSSPATPPSTFATSGYPYPNPNPNPHSNPHPHPGPSPHRPSLLRQPSAPAMSSTTAGLSMTPYSHTHPGRSQSLQGKRLFHPNPVDVSPGVGMSLDLTAHQFGSVGMDTGNAEGMTLFHPTNPHHHPATHYHPHDNGYQYANAGVQEKPARFKPTKEQLEILISSYNENKNPDAQTREMLAKQIGGDVKPKTLQIWFQNRRSKSRAKEREANLPKRLDMKARTATPGRTASQVQTKKTVDLDALRALMHDDDPSLIIVPISVLSIGTWTRFLTPGVGLSCPDLCCSVNLSSLRPLINLFVIHNGETFRISIPLDNSSISNIQGTSNPVLNTDSVAMNFDLHPGVVDFAGWRSFAGGVPLGTTPGGGVGSGNMGTGEWIPVGDFTSGEAGNGGKVEITGDKDALLGAFSRIHGLLNVLPTPLSSGNPRTASVGGLSSSWQFPNTATTIASSTGSGTASGDLFTAGLPLCTAGTQPPLSGMDFLSLNPPSSASLGSAHGPSHAFTASTSSGSGSTSTASDVQYGFGVTGPGATADPTRPGVGGGVPPPHTRHQSLSARLDDFTHLQGQSQSLIHPPAHHHSTHQAAKSLSLSTASGQVLGIPWSLTSSSASIPAPAPAMPEPLLAQTATQTPTFHSVMSSSLNSLNEPLIPGLLDTTGTGTGKQAVDEAVDEENDVHEDLDVEQEMTRTVDLDDTLDGDDAEEGS